jgi:hypothetical protein
VSCSLVKESMILGLALVGQCRNYIIQLGSSFVSRPLTRGWTLELSRILLAASCSLVKESMRLGLGLVGQCGITRAFGSGMLEWSKITNTASCSSVKE